MRLLRSDSAIFQSAVAISLTLAGGAALMLMTVMAGPRLIAVVFGAGLFGFVLAHSPNPRKLVLWLLVLALPMALSKHFDTIVYKGGGEQSFRIELYDIFVFLLLTFQIRDAFAGRVRGIRIPPVTWFWVAIMAIGVIDVIQGPWRTSGAHEVIRMFKVILLFIVLVNEWKDPRQILHCAVPLALGVLIQSGIAILQFAKGDLLGLGILGETTDKTIENLAYTSIEGSLAFRPSGLLLHANILGIFLATALPLLVAAVLVEKQILTRALLVVSLGAGAVAMILSQSRSAWVSFALAYTLLICLLFSHRKLRQRAVAVALGSGLTLAIAFVPMAGRIFTRLFASQADATVGREVFIGDFLRLISEHWLRGVGLNAYTYEVVPYLSFSVAVYDNWIPPVHNIYFLWWGETGILGLFLHLAILAAVISIGIRNLKVEDSALFAVNAACLGAMLAFLFDGFLSFSLRVNQPQRMFFFFAAIFCAIHYWRHGLERAAREHALKQS